MAEILQNKIDFALLVKVTDANPNGDPADGGRPRTDSDGYGEMSPECIKRKIRNRLQDMDEPIFVQAADRCDDGYGSLKERRDGELGDCGSEDATVKGMCGKFTDTRMFGQVLALKPGGKGKGKGKGNGEDDSGDGGSGKGVSIGIRGPVTVHVARSISPVDIEDMQITKSVNSEPGEGRGPDTMGTRHYVRFGLYKVKGSVNVQLAEKTGMTENDADKLKEALRTLFVNDSASARPDGSMEVVRLYWWRHDCKTGQYSSAKVHGSLKVKPKDGVDYPAGMDGYEISLEPLPGLEPEIIEGV